MSFVVKFCPFFSNHQRESAATPCFSISAVLAIMAILALFALPLPYPYVHPTWSHGVPCRPKAESIGRGSQPQNANTQPQAGCQISYVAQELLPVTFIEPQSLP